MIASEVAEFIRVINAGVPPVESQTPEAARTALRQRAARNPAPPRPTAEVEDMILALRGWGLPDVPARLYRHHADGPGLIVYFHGGGWVLGDLDTHDDIARDLAIRTARTVVSVDYPLAPERPYPAAVETAYASVRTLAGQLQPPAKVAVVGDSAGANIAAAVTLMSRDRGGPDIAAQVLAYPVLDDDFGTASYAAYAEGYHLTRAAMRWYWRQYLAGTTPAEQPYARPTRAADLSGLPSALVLAPEFDPLRSEGEQYARLLGDAGVAVRLELFPGMFHGFMLFADRFHEAARARASAAGFLRDRLG
jgi:acetyl esterase